MARESHLHERTGGMNHELPEELADTQRRLQSLHPQSHLDRQRLMYLAGQQAALKPPRRAWLWPAATAAMTLVAASCAALLLVPRPPQVIERVVYVNVSPPSPAESNDTGTPHPADDAGPTSEEPGQAVGSSPPNDDSRPERTTAGEESVADQAFEKTPARFDYLVARQIALEHGVDALPAAVAGDAGQAHAHSYREMTEQWLPRGDSGHRASTNSLPYDWRLWLQSGDRL